jgi:hypothetical protein
MAKKRHARQIASGDNKAQKKQRSEQVNQLKPSGDRWIPEEEDVELAVEVLEALEPSELLSQPRFRSLRKALSPLLSLLRPSSSTSLSARISTALEMGASDIALVLLAEMRSVESVPKLGAIQRWVRLAALAPDLSSYHALLDGILRTGDPSQVPPPSVPLQDLAGVTVKDNLAVHPPWSHADPISLTALSTSQTKDWSFHLIKTEEDARQGTHLQILGHSPDAILYDSADGQQQMTKMNVPFVKGASVIVNALSPAECAQFRHAADSIGFTDASGYSFTADITDGAAGCVWLVDSTVLDPLYSRLKPLLPPSIQGHSIKGLNARFRFYKYSLAAEYRPHIDGSWPGSGLVNDNAEYAFDAFGDRWSGYTLLIYLNDDFEGGETTFFWPGVRPGVLNGRGIVPRMGSVVVFPHGTTSGALLHEGSSVLSGYKYVIRTDILYEKEK